MINKLKNFFSRLKEEPVMNQSEIVSNTVEETLQEQVTANVDSSEEIIQPVQNLIPVEESSVVVTKVEDNLDDLLAREDSQYLFTDPRVVGWLSTAEQETLFSALLLFYQTNQTILDVGCGRGDLYGFLKQTFRTNDITYTGMDLNANLINIGKRKFPDADFVCTDILKDDVPDTYMWVVGSGLFNLKDQPDMFSYAKDVVEKMYQKSRFGVAFNLLCGTPEDMSEEDINALHIHDPAAWLDYLLNKYNKVICRHDYLSGDVTFLIFK